MQTDIGALVNDKIIHERARLLIVTYLAAAGVKSVPFGEIKEKLDFTSGNLSIQLKTLAEAGYITIFKEFRNNKPLTSVTLTAKGGAALKEYIERMDVLIKKVRAAPPA